MLHNKIAEIVFIVLIIACPFQSARSQQLNYREVFGKDWDKALSFIELNSDWIQAKLEDYHVSYADAVAVIFPELVRYSALRDKIEISLLKTLYVNMGQDYANFSIGPFQMKPSFGELIREKAKWAMGSRAGRLFKQKSEFEDISSYRTSIVRDLEDPVTQLNYLIVFIKICEKSFNLKKMADDSRIKFLATAYNYGFWKTKEQIEYMTDKKYFSTTLIKSVTYSYADVSLFWYHQFLDKQNP